MPRHSWTASIHKTYVSHPKPGGLLCDTAHDPSGQPPNQFKQQVQDPAQPQDEQQRQQVVQGLLRCMPFHNPCGAPCMSQCPETSPGHIQIKSDQSDYVMNELI
jgi:hypothetical protein